MIEWPACLLVKIFDPKAAISSVQSHDIRLFVPPDPILHNIDAVTPSRTPNIIGHH